MQREFPAIDFTSQAEVRSQAEYRRAEEISGLFKLLFSRWATVLRDKRRIFAQTSADVGNRRLTSARS